MDTDALTSVSYLSFWACGPRNSMKIARSNHVRCFSAFLLHQRDSSRFKICLRSRLAVGKTISEEYFRQRSELLVRAVLSWLFLDSTFIWGWLTKRETAFPMDLCPWGQVSRKTAQVRSSTLTTKLQMR